MNWSSLEGIEKERKQIILSLETKLIRLTIGFYKEMRTGYD